MFSKNPVASVFIGFVAALGSYSDTIAQVPGDVVTTIKDAPANWDDLEKALVSMAVACVSQLVLTLVPKLFKTLSHVRLKTRNFTPVAVEKGSDQNTQISNIEK